MSQDGRAVFSKAGPLASPKAIDKERATLHSQLSLLPKTQPLSHVFSARAQTSRTTSYSTWQRHRACDTCEGVVGKSCPCWCWGKAGVEELLPKPHSTTNCVPCSGGPSPVSGSQLLRARAIKSVDSLGAWRSSRARSCSREGGEAGLLVTSLARISCDSPQATLSPLS